MFRATGPFFFEVAGELLGTLRRVGLSPKVMILRTRLLPLLDASGVQAFKQFFEQANVADAKVVMSCVQPKPKSMRERVDLDGSSDKVFCATDFAKEQALALDLLGLSKLAADP